MPNERRRDCNLDLRRQRTTTSSTHPVTVRKTRAAYTSRVASRGTRPMSGTGRSLRATVPALQDRENRCSRHVKPATNDPSDTMDVRPPVVAADAADDSSWNCFARE
jgi:hypothetical protein